MFGVSKTLPYMQSLTRVYLPEGFQRAHPAAEIHPEPTEGPEAAGSPSKEVSQRLPRPAPRPPDEGTHQGGEGE